jgi:hypothetical protein
LTRSIPSLREPKSNDRVRYNFCKSLLCQRPTASLLIEKRHRWFAEEIEVELIPMVSKVKKKTIGDGSSTSKELERSKDAQALQNNADDSHV